MNFRLPRFLRAVSVGLGLAIVLTGCASTEVLETPKTGYQPETKDVKDPALVWTSRTLGHSFDYLGQVSVRSWSYDSAVERLIEGGRTLRADAVVDIHYEKVGFLTTMHAFAIKYR